MRHAIPTLALMAVLTGCTSGATTYEERIAYLRQVAQQGAEAGNLLRDQDAPRIDKERCGRVFEGLTRPEDYPADTASGGVSKEWAAQIREFFIDSCVSGKPRSAPGDATRPTTTSPTLTTTPAIPGPTTTTTTTTTTPATSAPTTTTTTTTTTP